MVTTHYFFYIYEKNAMTCYLLIASMPDGMGDSRGFKFLFLSNYTRLGIKLQSLRGAFCRSNLLIFKGLLR